MPSKKALNKKEAAQWLGKPVMVVLKDGSYYVGMMSSVEKDRITLSGLRPDKKLPVSIRESEDKAQISGFLSSLFGGLGGGPGVTGAASGGFGGLGIFQLFGQIMPHIQVGMNVVKSIMPLMGMLKA